MHVCTTQKRSIIYEHFKANVTILITSHFSRTHTKRETTTYYCIYVSKCRVVHTHHFAVMVHTLSIDMPNCHLCLQHLVNIDVLPIHNEFK